MAMRVGTLETRHPRVDHLGVALDAEDEGDVDADPGGQGLRDRGEALGCRGNLDEDVVAIDHPVEEAGLEDGGVGVARQAGIDLDGHASIDAVGCTPQGREDVAGIAYVRGRQGTHGIVH